MPTHRSRADTELLGHRGRSHRTLLEQNPGDLAPCTAVRTRRRYRCRDGTGRRRWRGATLLILVAVVFHNMIVSYFLAAGKGASPAVTGLTDTLQRTAPQQETHSSVGDAPSVGDTSLRYELRAPGLPSMRGTRGEDPGH
ncbi:hypothetical protein GCM10009676_04500 [Prauserella halophila]|uniref:Uncharacterized protein n=1 Tax=Prauserella halophila TaxID=185641 RepID=A0ABN1W037_9PSEU